MSIDKTTKKDVFDAVDKIEREGIVLHQNGLIVINGKAYPSKKIMRYTKPLANENKDWAYSGEWTVSEVVNFQLY